MKLRINEKETPNIEIKDSKFTNNNIMIITIFSEISSDGCDIEILNGNKVLFKDSYGYGYNASYNRKFAKYAHQDVINAQKYGYTGYIERPYIGDIITELCKKYNIDKHDIIFKQGKNVFNGDSVPSKKVSDFINNHIDGIVEESYKKLQEQNVDIEVKHKGILEVPEGKNVDDLPLSHFVNLAKKKGLSKITKALNNLQVWNKNDDPKLSKWAGDMIDKLNKKLKKDESISVKEANNGLYVIKKDNKYVKDFSNGEEFTKQYDKAEKFTDKQSANEYAAKYSKWYGKGYKVVTISSVSENINNELAQFYAYKIYSDMTDGNTFVVSPDKEKAKRYGSELYRIYRNYNEDTIDNDVANFYNNLPDDVFVTDPEYWADEKIDVDTYIIYEYDNDTIRYAVTLVGYNSFRF